MKNGFWVLLIAVLLVCSCESTSQSTVTSKPAPGVPAPEAAAPVPAAAAEADAVVEEETPIAALPLEAVEEEPEEVPEPDGLNEPFLDFAEAATTMPPPPEEPLNSMFPEPLAPAFPEAPLVVDSPALVSPEPPPAQAAATPPPVTPPAAPPVTPSAVPPTVPPPAARPIPPNPPAFIRPAEEDRPPPAAREPLPRPPAPLPEPPARTPPLEIREPGIVFSRVVRATVGQLVEVPFRGTGWVYLGELGSRPGIVYSGRRLDPEGQSFVFRAEAAGTYGLKFYKQDFVRDYVLNDHVQVVVGDPPEAAATGWFNPAIDRGRVVAEPRWPNTQEEAEAFGRASGASSAGSTGAVVHGVSPAGNAATVPDSVTAAPEATSGNGQAAAAETSPGATGIDAGQPVPTGASPTPGSPAAAPPAAQATGTTPSLQNKAGGLDEGVVTVRPASAVPPEPRGDLLPSGYLERAQQEFDAGRVATAIAALDQFRERYPAGSDEAWWLYGQFYEAPTAYRDIRTSLDYYRRLVREYPQSSRYNEARRRIAYLERYYINIQ